MKINRCPQWRIFLLSGGEGGLVPTSREVKKGSKVINGLLKSYNDNINFYHVAIIFEYFFVYRGG